MTLEEFIPIFKNALTTGSYSRMALCELADSVNKDVANFVDYVAYWDGMIRDDVFDAAGKKCPELYDIYKSISHHD